MPFYICIPSLFKNYAGLAFWPFIFIKHKRYKKDLVFMNHERIHLRQQLELGILPFYMWYAVEYTYYRLSGKCKFEAYRTIRFEQEAYQNEKDLLYLKKRKIWSFLNF